MVWCFDKVEKSKKLLVGRIWHEELKRGELRVLILKFQSKCVSFAARICGWKFIINLE